MSQKISTGSGSVILSIIALTVGVFVWKADEIIQDPSHPMVVAERPNRAGVIPLNTTNQQTAIVASTEFTNNKFQYSFTIPKGWRVYRAAEDFFDTLYLTNLKETDPVDKIFESMMVIKVIHDDKVRIHPLVGYPVVAKNPVFTYETLETTSGAEMVYAYSTAYGKKRPIIGYMELKSGMILEGGAAANMLDIEFPHSSEIILFDAQARDLLASFRLLP